MPWHLIRHPRPQVAPGICYGQLDLPLVPGEPEHTRAALAGILPAGAVIVSSPLTRCRQLAEALHPGGVRIDPRLMEMHFGAWEGRRWEDIPRAEIDAWADAPADYRPGGAESLGEMAARVADCARSLAAIDAPALVLVCHGGTIRLLRALARGHTPREAARLAAATPHAIAYGALERLDPPPQGPLTCPAP